MQPPVTPKEVQLAVRYRAHVWHLTSVLKLQCPKWFVSRFDQDLMITLTLLNVLACAFGAIRLIWLANSLLLSCENGEERLIQLTMCNKKQQGTFWIT